MKIGAENKKSVIAMVVLVVVAIALLFYRFKGLFSGGSASAAPSVPHSATSAAPQPAKPPAGGISQPDTTNTRLLLDVLENSRNVKYQEGRNIFSMEAPKIESLAGNVRTNGTSTPTPPPTPPPTPTPFPIKYYGFANKPGDPKKVFMQEPGGEVFVVSEGQIVARRFRVVQIQPNTVTLEDVITGARQPVQLTVR